MRRFGAALAGAALAAALTTAAQTAPRAMSLDQCADQYVLALSPRADIAAVSGRADDYDSYLREKAGGLPTRRATLEGVIAARPDVVVRYWGGDARLMAMLERRGIAVVKIDEAEDFEGVRANVRRVASALHRRAAGEALIADMDAHLARAEGAWGGASALYITPSGFTAGQGTLIEAVLAAAGLKGAAARPGYAPVSLERLAMQPPEALVLGFFDAFTSAMTRWGLGRHRVTERLIEERAIGSLSSAIAGCPGWFAAEGAEGLAKAALR